MTNNEMIAVITAHSNGETIQYREKGFDDEWVDCKNPVWSFDRHEYRVKTEPTYRPYATANELYKDIIKHNNGWISPKVNPNDHSLIVDFYANKIFLGNGCLTHYDNLLDSYVWADDGSPCGVKEE